MLTSTTTFNINKFIYYINDDVLYLNDKGFDINETELLLKKTKFLVEENNTKFLVLDLTKSTRPSAEKMHLIKSQMLSISKTCKDLSVITGENTLINVAFRFIMINMHIEFISVSSTLDEALEKLKCNTIDIL